MQVRVNKTLRKVGQHQMPKTMAHITPMNPVKLPKPINMAQHEASMRGLKLPKIRTVKLMP